MAKGRKSKGKALPKAESYRHPEADTPLRPEVGTQAQFKKKKPPVTYRYDSSLSPALDWDGQNHARELGEWLIACIEEAAALAPPHLFDKPREMRQEDGKVVATVRGLQDAVEQLKRLSQPFLNWAGKAERLSFEVPTLPLFVHERLSTKGIIETLKGHRKTRMEQMDLFGDPQHPVIDQVLRAYEYRDKWVNRLILGDSLLVMNSLLHYEGLGGQVQMIYLDPPYGIQFGSNFQPFVRKRNVKHNEDEDLTREPEMVKAYRDTWEQGLHSYLTYLRDRLLLCRELLTNCGSIFIQISDENLHHIKEIMDEVFGSDNFCGIITFRKTLGPAAKLLPSGYDYLIWYSKNKDLIKYRQLFIEKKVGDVKSYNFIEAPDGKTFRRLTSEELETPSTIPLNWKIFQMSNLAGQGSGPEEKRFYNFNGKKYDCGEGKHWKTHVPEGMDRLASANRIIAAGSQLNYKRYLEDFPASGLTTMWEDTGSAGFSATDPKIYVVQTDTKVIERCILMTTNPGDLVLDPTCGSGTSAYASEKWGRRWITIDVSRVPLALARQRLLATTFPYYELKDEVRGPAAGFIYKRKQNKKGEEVGGIVPHIKLENIANNEPADEEVLVDRPEVVSGITRVTGPFCVEGTIPAPLDWEAEATDAAAPGDHHTFVDRMLEVLRKSPVLHVGGGKTVTLKQVRPPAKTLSLSAEALVPANGEGGEDLDMATLIKSPLLASGPAGRPVALVFGPENGAVSEKLVYEAAREAHGKNYTHLFVIGFAIQPNARKLVEDCEDGMGIAATYVQATPDLMMGDLLKNLRSSQIFSVCGLPEIRLTRVPAAAKGEPDQYQVGLLGLDVFDPATMENYPLKAHEVPAWFLDTDYNGLCFKVTQAFFPRTGAWESLKKALKGLYEDSVWDHLAGTVSAPFEAGEQGQVAVKVIDDRGNELLVVKGLKEAEK
jgi:adenine-specific DNA-methyltransferase